MRSTLVLAVLAAASLLYCDKSSSNDAGANTSDANGTRDTSSGGASGGVSGAAGSPGGAIPEGCEFLAETNPAPECSADYAPIEACEQIKTENNERDYTLEVVPSGTDEERVDRVDCLLGWLEALGLNAETDSDREQIEVVARYEDIEPVLGSAALTRYWVQCKNPRCEYCELFDEQQCTQDVFCTAYEGWRLDDPENEECLDWETTTFASCMSAQEGCGQAGSHARDSNGDCWFFTTFCYTLTLLPVDDTCGGDTAAVPFCE